jgi:hypothetical protein
LRENKYEAITTIFSIAMKEYDDGLLGILYKNGKKIKT